MAVASASLIRKRISEASSRLLMVDFYADWCGPCRMLAPILERVAADPAKNVDLMKCNTDNEAELASEYRINSLPTVVFFKEGKEVDRFSGAVPEDVLVKYISKNQ